MNQIHWFKQHNQNTLSTFRCNFSAIDINPAVKRSYNILYVFENVQTRVEVIESPSFLKKYDICPTSQADGATNSTRMLFHSETLK